MLTIEESYEKTRLMLPHRFSIPVPGAGSFSIGQKISILSSSGGVFFYFMMLFGLLLASFGVVGTFGPWREILHEMADPRFYIAAGAFGLVFFLFALRFAQVAYSQEKNRRLSTQWKTRDSKRGSGNDFPWKKEMKPDYSTGAIGTITGRIAFLGFLSLLALMLINAWNELPLIIKVILLVLEAFGLLILFDSMVKVWHFIHRNESVIRFEKFPVFTGEKLTATLHLRKPVRVTADVRVILRCVAEELSHANVFDPFAIFTATQYIQATDVPLQDLAFAFDVPRELPGTDMFSEERPVYWQAVVKIAVAGPDMESTFLLPIYAQE